MGRRRFAWIQGGFYLELRLIAAGLDLFDFAQVEAAIDLRASVVTPTEVSSITSNSGVILEQEPLFIKGLVESISPSSIQQIAILSERTALVEGTITQTITRAYAQELDDTLRTETSVILRKIRTSDNSAIAAVVSVLTVDHRDADATLGRVYTQAVSLSL